MIEEILSLLVQNSAAVSIWLTLGIAYLLISLKERSLKAWVSGRADQLTTQLEGLPNLFIEKGDDALAGVFVRLETSLDERIKLLKTDFNEWLPGALPGLGDKLVKEPLAEIMESQLMSRLGKASGVVRGEKAAMNELAEAAMPEGLKLARDQIIKMAPQLKPILKDPGKIMSIAKTFGIDLSQLGDNSQGSNSGGDNRW